jgi:hypothetical protein
VRWLALVAFVIGCEQSPPNAAQIAERGWAAHEAVVGVGEAQSTCPAAGAAMQKAFVEHRQAFVDAMALDRDKARLEQATAYMEAHADRYGALEIRMQMLAERCPDDATVQAAFAQMANP